MGAAAVDIGAAPPVVEVEEPILTEVAAPVEVVEEEGLA